MLRKTDFKDYTERDLDDITWNLNTTRRNGMASEHLSEFLANLQNCT